MTSESYIIKKDICDSNQNRFFNECARKKKENSLKTYLRNYGRVFREM